MLVKMWLGTFSLALLAGCQTALEQTSFAPLEARLEPVPDGGAQYFVLVNTSGRELQNFSYSAYIYNENGQNATKRNRPVYEFQGSGAKWGPGLARRFYDRRMRGQQLPITHPITKVVIVGHCDEGPFRQTVTLR
jgi:hypothetical protein